MYVRKRLLARCRRLRHRIDLPLQCRPLRRGRMFLAPRYWQEPGGSIWMRAMTPPRNCSKRAARTTTGSMADAEAAGPLGEWAEAGQEAVVWEDAAGWAAEGAAAKAVEAKATPIVRRCIFFWNRRSSSPLPRKNRRLT